MSAANITGWWIVGNNELCKIGTFVSKKEACFEMLDRNIQDAYVEYGTRDVETGEFTMEELPE